MRLFRILETVGLLGLSSLLLFPSSAVLAQGWGTVEGRVTDAASGEAIPGATILVAGTNFGTATDDNGDYALSIPGGRYQLRFSAVGYETRLDSVVVGRNQTVRLDAALHAAVIELDEVTVEEAKPPAEAGVHEIDPEDVRNAPTPINDGLRVLKTMPGVAANNELSNQFSVRGGGFNENLIFINGFEVYLPFRPRQGEQEGLSLFNAEMAERATFYTGGFPARYGGKLSSALDVQYRRPDGEPLSGSAYASLLDAGATAGASALDGRLGWVVGLRKSRPSRFFRTQELKGTYQPDYTDLQGVLSYRIAPGHEFEALGMWADHTFELDPRGRKTFFGVVSTDPTQPSDLQSLWIDFDGQSQETDGYETHFGGLRLSNRLSPRLRFEHNVAYFGTEETEVFDLRGSSVLYQVDPNSDPDSDEGKIPRGTARQEETADNRVAVDKWTAKGRWMLNVQRHAAEAGWYARRLAFDDHLQEKSVIIGRTTEGDIARIVADSLRDSASLNASQAGFYVQDAFDVLPEQRDRFVVTAGLRTDYYSFNDEWTVSPRLTARFLASDRLTLNGAWGIYYQAPTYRELRGKPEPGETILGALNRDLRSQKSMQFVGGLEYFLPARRLYLRAEAYWKELSRLISYDIENVRVEYSGENDAEGHAYGLDLQLRGELVPGMESWINYSFLVAREDFLPAFQSERNDGLIPRPTDQRHTFSLFVQDYIPTDPTWKLHLRMLFGSGLPYTPPIPGDREVGSNIVVQVPGERLSARYPEYRRVDMGVSKLIPLADDVLGAPVRLQLTGELLNVFDMTNTIAYTWIPDRSGIWQRVPTRLTPRTFNVRLRVEF